MLIPIKYKLQRQPVKVKKGWFKSEEVLVWCIVEYYVYKWTDFDHTGTTDMETYKDRIVFKTTDDELALKEFENFKHNLED